MASRGFDRGESWIRIASTMALDCVRFAGSMRPLGLSDQHVAFGSGAKGGVTKLPAGAESAKLAPARRLQLGALRLQELLEEAMQRSDDSLFVSGTLSFFDMIFLTFL